MTLERLEKDLQNQAKTITELVTAEARRQDRDKFDEQLVEQKEKHLDERLDRLEARVTAIYGLGRWLLAAAGSTLILAVVTFAVRGGFFVG